MEASPSPRCPTCGSDWLSKDGWTDTGKSQRWKCKNCGRRTTNPTKGSEPPVFQPKIPKGSCYVVTCAQNATPIHKGFWQSLKTFCRQNNAHLICIPIRYKNPTSQQETKKYTKDFEWWADEVVPYLYSSRERINKNLILLGDLRTNPTAVRPLSGLDSITGAMSGIVPHTKIEFKTVPTPHHKMPKIMITTGAVTEPNYSSTKAGARGEFSHSLSAVVVDLDGSAFHLRHLNADSDGSFIDLDKKYVKTCVTKAPEAEALVVGDTHVGFTDRKTTNALFRGRRSLFNRVKPKRVVLHDLTDNYSRSHHHRSDPFLQVGKHKFGWHNLEKELNRAIDYIDNEIPTEAEIILPTSNHPESITRWLAESNWKNDPENAEFYLRTALSLVESLQWTEYGVETVDPFAEYIKRKAKTAKRCVFLSKTDFYEVHGIELGMHGHKGPNGARGSIGNLSKIGVKSVIGHGHSPGIQDGCYQVGTSALKMGYAAGSPSSWLSTHCIIYANGKRTLITIIDGKYEKERE